MITALCSYHNYSRVTYQALGIIMESSSHASVLQQQPVAIFTWADPFKECEKLGLLIKSLDPDPGF
jgi:hypothetical protein